jgi:hypothetical protein
MTSKICHVGIAILALSIPQALKASILPDNNLYLMDCIECETGIGKEEFERVIQEAQNAFGPIVEAFGEELEIVNKWNDSTVNASALQGFGSWTVTMYGGLARRPEITSDGFALVLCHEIGHHLGGFPFVSGWGANEGQSDYFATNHCAPYLWKNDLEINATFKDIIPEAPKTQCESSYKDENDRNLCYRIMSASKSISNLLGSLTNTEVFYDKPDSKVVNKTVNSHPAAQCRLDTYMAGSLCNLTYEPELIPGKSGRRGTNNIASEKESSQVNCADSTKYLSSVLRPRCWFKPQI